MSDTELKKGRQSSAELLRIIAMLLIVLSHFSFYGVNEITPIYEMKPCFNKYMLESVQLGFLGVDIFTIIAGYFGVKSAFKATKLIKLILQVFFYSVVIFAVMCAAGIIEFSIKEAVKALFPAIFKKYWFFSAYILLYILSPFINKLINSLNRKNHLILIAVLWLIWGLIPLVSGSDFYGTHFSELLILYLVGSYLRIYPDNIFSKAKTRKILLAASIAFFPISVALMNGLTHISGYFNNHYTYFYSEMSLNTIIAAAALVITFVNLNMKQSRFINIAASCTFGVYLIHDNPYFREYLWSSLIKANEKLYSPSLIVYMIACAAVIFTVCAIIDLLRQTIIEKPVMSAVNRIYPNIKQRLVKIIDKKSKA